MAVNINIEPEESKPSKLERFEFNNHVLDLSKHVPFARTKAIMKLNRVLKLLKRKEAKDGGQRGKNQSKAEKLTEQVQLLKKLRKLDITKLLFLIRTPATEGLNVKKTCVQEEALYHVADYEPIKSTLQLLKDRYPNFVEDAFKHLKAMGMQYRKARIAKIKKSRSKVHKVLAQERLLLVTAHQLMGCERELILLNISEDDLIKPNFSKVDAKSEQQSALDGVEASSYPTKNRGKIKQFSRTNSTCVSVSNAQMEDPISDAPRKKHKRTLKGTEMGGKPKKKGSPGKMEGRTSNSSLPDKARGNKEASTPHITSKQIGSAKILRLFNLQGLQGDVDLNSA